MAVDFAVPALTSDGWLLLFKQTDTKLNLLSRLAHCFRDARYPSPAQHAVAELLPQRAYSLAKGYENLNDNDRLRHYPLLGAVSGKANK